MTTPKGLQKLLDARFSDAPQITTSDQTIDVMARRSSCRAFQDKPVPQATLDLLCATALASPSKSDLQQRDIILVQSPKARQKLASLVSGQAWVADAPMIAVFCGNNRRQRQLHEWRGVPFANDHLDAFFNAATDAAIALGAFTAAAEALGLGTCPISAVRNEARAVSTLLGLPHYVFPFAGLAIGYPAGHTPISPRLPLGVTVHTDRFNEDGLQTAVQCYDTARAKTLPYASQRGVAEFGQAEPYTWSEDKVRQYSRPERETFADYIRAQGFRLT